jgi:wyosine [tRNA(Phe)-imidazoG37] synthetase (radical SAM superfamily)
MKKTHLYGPVPSRRLGLSLGVDVVPFKVCSFDCIYCQLGRTTQKSIHRKSFFSPEIILQQLRSRLEDGLQTDYVSFSGSGEPTLNADLGSLIRQVKGISDVPVAVITNGSLLWDPEVQKELLVADLVMPSLDAGSPEVFRTVNRAHASLALEKIVAGLAEFRSCYDGQIRLEILLLDGINTTSEELEKMQALAKHIRPDGIDLNTVARPPAEVFAKPLSYERLEEIRDQFGKSAEIVFRPPLLRRAGSSHQLGASILQMVARRPCTIEDLSSSLGCHRHEVAKFLAALVQEGQIKEKRYAEGTFFVAMAEVEGRDQRPETGEGGIRDTRLEERLSQS